MVLETFLFGDIAGSGDIGSGDIGSGDIAVWVRDIAGSRVIAGSGDIGDICFEGIAVWRHCWFWTHR